VTTLTLTTEPVIITPANPNRTVLLISNLSDTDLYLFPTGAVTEFTTVARPIKENGTFEVSGPGCYKGPIFAMTSAASDVRIFEA